MRKEAWVIQGRRLAQKVVNKCIHCRKARAQVCQQVMGDLPVERSRPAAPFQFTSVDLFGPYLVKDDIKRRVSMKVWGVVFCCMASRALYLDLVSSMSTESFLMTYQRFVAIRGHPLKVWSDPGTTFIGARSFLEDLYAFLRSQDVASLEEYAAKNGTSWMWKVLPADSPHRNGAAEAAVKIAKRALQSLSKSPNLTFSEFLTALHLAANLANERPIDARIQSQEDRIEYVTPNSLLLGRASLSGDIKSFNFDNYPYKRLREVQTQVNEFWRAWCQLAGPGLFIRTKWHTTERNVAVGDVVWLCDQNALRVTFYNSHLSEYPIQPITGLEVEAASGETVPYLGYVSLILKFPKNFVETEPEVSTLALVVPDLRTNNNLPVLIGTNALDVLYDEHCHGKNPYNFSPIYGYRQILRILKLRKEVDSTGRIGLMTLNSREQKVIPAQGKVLLDGYVKVGTTSEYAIVEQPSTSTLPGGIFVECCLVTLPKQSPHKLPVWVRNESEHDVTLPSSCVIAELHVPSQVYDPLSASDKSSDTVNCCTVTSQPGNETTKSGLTFGFGDSPLPQEWKDKITHSLNGYLDVLPTTTLILGKHLKLNTT
ncbi:hypothetical protein DPEC_G00213940 [Dallia pectoralis]|uniref:Uncharacterized protein n=1 Tax=Dallia pectoralis TaxID=75939 RepID=A0ACC2G6W1_DALPE|nr:hypothetical protein DPEC_G00213940 [Dallia pectoralis]